jgi:phosphoribosylglycinamide formyltransferase-1
MYGRHVHEAVLAAGVSSSGPTVHLVNERYDEGPILAHVEVPVEAGDTPERLAERVLREEHRLLWRVIRDRFCAALNT